MSFIKSQRTNWVFNTNHELNVKAGLNEKHIEFLENGYVVEGYSDFQRLRF